MPNSAPPRRRDLLTTTAYAVAGTGALVALWPFTAALAPDADDIAKRRLFHLNNLNGTTHAITSVDGTPMLVFIRTPQQVQSLQQRWPENPQGSDWKTSALRSLRPGIMVCSAHCPREACVVAYTVEAIQCPCCASRFDLTGRKISGPAPTDLLVPDYRFISPYEIEFSASERV